jgi:hypothetical protein
VGLKFAATARPDKDFAAIQRCRKKSLGPRYATLPLPSNYTSKGF